MKIFTKSLLFLFCIFLFSCGSTPKVIEDPVDVVENDAFGGIVKVTAPDPYTEGRVIVIAADSAGNMLMKPLTFIENK